MLCGVFIRTLRTKNNCQSVTDGLEMVGTENQRERRDLLLKPLQTVIYLKYVVEKLRITEVRECCAECSFEHFVLKITVSL
jgi:hypothetical protein